MFKLTVGLHLDHGIPGIALLAGLARRRGLLDTGVGLGSLWSRGLGSCWRHVGECEAIIS